MLKLMKYELRKMAMPLLIMLLILVALQAGFLVGSWTEREDITFISLGLVSLLMFVLYLYILISGIVSYSRELKDRTGYLVFMAPVRPVSVVLSKLLFTVLAAVAIAALFAAIAILDYQQLFRAYGLTRNVWDQINFMVQMLFRELNITLNQIVLLIAYTAGTVLIEIVMVMCTAYLAITLSATLLQNRRGFLKGGASFLLFAALSWGSTQLGNRLLPSDDFMTIQQMLDALGWSVLYYFGISALFAWASAALLKRKVSL